MHTCIVVPAFAGSCPAQLSANGSAVPATVDVVTMAKSETAQWAGLRFLYLAITGVVWICGGEIAFFVATLAMRRFLAGIDRPPELAEIEATAI